MLLPDLAGLSGSFLGDIDTAARDELLDNATLLEVERGALVYPDQSERRLGVLFEGIARAYITGPDGRQLTLRYARGRSIITTATSGATNNPLPVALQAVSPVSVIDFDFGQIVALQATNTTVIRALAAESTRRLADVYRAFAASYFGSFKERLAAHLLDCAEPTREGADLVAPITQQELAVALGTVREVVSRALQELQTEKVVEIGRGRVRILDERRLVTTAGSWWIPSRHFSFDGASADDSFEAAPQPVVAIDPSGDIVYANPAVSGTFGWQPREIMGQPVTVLIPVPTGASVDAILGGFMRDVVPGPIGLGADFHGRRADGSEFPAEITVLPVKRAGTVLVYATIVDVTYRTALRAQLRVATTDLAEK